jgi:Na+-translocating ferredoxin:NAD+ oxidoreductase subunit C
MARNKIKVPGGIMLLKDEKAPDPGTVETLPATPYVTIPLVQHFGRPAKPCVYLRDYVSMGQIIGTAQGECSAPVHASISGTVVAIERYPFSSNPAAVSITIENDGKDEFASPIPYDKPMEESLPQELLSKIALSGIIDQNGIPLHDLLSEAQKNRVETLILNGLITEPFLHAEESLMLGHAQKILAGADIIRRIVGTTRCLIVVSEKRTDIAKAFAAQLDNRAGDYTLIPAKPKYPHHFARLLAHDCTGIGCSAFDTITKARCIVIGVEAAAAVRDALVELRPSFERVVTVGGQAIPAPKNIRVRIGTPVRALLDACSADWQAIKKLVAGGPLSGDAVQDASVPVVKSMNALLAFTSLYPAPSDESCIKCGYCLSVCPIRLDPARLVAYISARNVQAIQNLCLDECIECGCCAYVCPSHIDMVHWLGFGKNLLFRQNQSQRAEPRVAA